MALHFLARLRPVARLAVLLALVVIRPAYAADSGMHVLAAGSLTDAVNELIGTFHAPDGAIAAPTFGPSGVLREHIESGQPTDLFLSADMIQPRKLAAAGKGGPVILFTRNRLCLIARPQLGLASDNMLERLLDPSVRLATSTPGSDPAGDYTWAVFKKAEALHPGAQAILQNKAMKLMGAADSQLFVPGHSPVGGIFLADKADAMMFYCSGAAGVMKEVPGLVSVAVPPALSVGPAYGMIVLSDNPVAARFALFVMSEAGQAILARQGFDPVAQVAGD